MHLFLELVFVVTVAGVAAGVIALAGAPERRRVALAVGAWLAGTAALAATGILVPGDGPPRLVALPWIAIIAGVVAIRSPRGRAAVAAAPPGAVMALLSFRVPVELILWGLYLAGSIPVQMTFEGRNVDVLVGLTAIPAAVAAWGSGRRRWRLAIAWHAAGLAALVNIVAIAILSMPGPLRAFAAGPANTIVGQLPYIWLPAFLVPIAALGHVVGIDQALRARRG